MKFPPNIIFDIRYVPLNAQYSETLKLLKKFKQYGVSIYIINNYLENYC